MEVQMKCMQCGSAMTTKRENVPYKALPGAVLVGVEVSRCAACGEYEVAIPAIDELNKVLASAVIRKKGRLRGAEVRFLRTYLGYSGADFAKLIGSSASTVSKWESDAQPIGHHSDLLLRALIVVGKKVDEYPIETFAGISASGDKRAKPEPYVFTPAAKKWKPTTLAA
jgi:putative zinc finger/helix-turn-helix YgiT family protein